MIFSAGSGANREEGRTDLSAPWRGVRTKRYTCARLEDILWSLFDNLNDPCRMNNLAGQPEAAWLEWDMEALPRRGMDCPKDSWAAILMYTIGWTVVRRFLISISHPTIRRITPD